MREMGATGVITPADVDVFRAFCDAAARYQFAARMLDSSGPLVRGQKGELVKGVKPTSIDDLVDLVADDGRKVIWH